MTAVPADTQEYLIFRDIERHGPEVQERFVKLVRSGQSLRMAQMLACQQSPTTKHTDSVFNREARMLMNEMKPKHRKKIVELAEKAGVRTQGRYYIGGLARYTDPEAWVSTVDEAVDTCKRKQLTASKDGIFAYQSSEAKPPEKKPMAEDIKRRYVQEYLRRDARLREQVSRNRRKLKDLESEILAKHGSAARSGRRS